MLRRTLCVVVVVVVAQLPIVMAAAQTQCWFPPVPADVVDEFREPACRWCPGNRGLEYGTSAGERVTVVATGVVVFSGSVVGTLYVVVELADGLRLTYGNLERGLPALGAVVVAGATIGTAAGHVHFGVHDGERYIDPAPLIGTLRGVPRLVPTDGSARLPSPPRLTCD